MNKQDEVIKYLNTVEQASLKEIYSNTPIYYYCNELKHLGALMSRMVKSGKVSRVKRGVFKKNEGCRIVADKIDPNQKTLF